MNDLNPLSINRLSSDVTARTFAALHEAVQTNKTFREQTAQRLREFSDYIRKLHARLTKSEDTCRTLEEKVRTLEADNKRLVRENTDLRYNQQALDNAITLACADFGETAKLISNATRTTLPVGPVEPRKPVVAKPEVSIERDQPRSSLTLDKIFGRQPEAEVAKLLVNQAAESSVGVEVREDAAMDLMLSEIEDMLSKDFDGLVQSQPAEQADMGDGSALS